MPPVSPVFHTETTVSVGLKMYSEWEYPFYDIRCPCCEAERISQVTIAVTGRIVIERDHVF